MVDVFYSRLLRANSKLNLCCANSRNCELFGKFFVKASLSTIVEDIQGKCKFLASSHSTKWLFLRITVAKIQDEKFETKMSLSIIWQRFEKRPWKTSSSQFANSIDHHHKNVVRKKLFCTKLFFRSLNLSKSIDHSITGCWFTM